MPKAIASELLYNELNKAEKRDFEFVTATCRGDINSLATMVEEIREDSIGDLKYFITVSDSNMTEENIVDRNGIGKNVDRLLNSKGYLLALGLCFPRNEIKRHQYTINLLLLDAFGKITTVSILTISGASIYKSLSYLGKKLAVAPTVSVFRRLKASDEFIEKVPRYMGGAAVISFNVVAFGTLSTHVYKMRKNREIMTEALAGPNMIEAKSNFDENFALYNEAKELAALAKTSDQKAVMENLIIEQRKNVIYHLNILLQGEPQEKETLLTLKEQLEKES